jgi:hypothetical protein
MVAGHPKRPELALGSERARAAVMMQRPLRLGGAFAGHPVIRAGSIATERRYQITDTHGACRPGGADLGSLLMGFSSHCGRLASWLASCHLVVRSYQRYADGQPPLFPNCQRCHTRYTATCSRISMDTMQRLPTSI